jgi:hypothetical protein
MLLSERWVQWVKEECLSKLILFCEGSLRKALTDSIISANGIPWEWEHSVISEGGRAAEAPWAIDRVS